MKDILLYGLMSCILIFSAKAQVGINTNTPIGILHIDAGIVGNTTNDVIVDNNGRMGIGTTTPVTKLHIKAPTTTQSIAIRDGNERKYKLLTSNDQGVGTWQFQGVSMIKGNLSPLGRTYLVADLILDPSAPDDPPLYPLDGTIVLPPGRWCVYSNFLSNTTGATDTDTFASYTWIRLSYSDIYGGAPSEDIKGSGRWTSGPVYAIPNGVIQGFNIILNETSENKTYYLGIVFADKNKVSNAIQINNLANAQDPENGILAIKVGEN